MKFPWFACLLFASISLALACKGGGGGGSSGFLEVVGTAPDSGEENVQVEARIVVRVSERIDPATLSSETFFLTDEEGAIVPSTVEIFDEPNAQPSQIGTAAELHPDAPLAVLTNFTVVVTTGLMSTSGKTFEEDYDWTFMTIDAEWGEAEWVEPLGDWNSSAPQIGLDEQLSAIAVWQIEDADGTALFANHYDRVGLWGEPVEIDDGNGTAANPRLAVDGDGNGFAVWERQDLDTAERRIWTNRYDAAGSAWQTPALLQNGDVTPARTPAVAANLAGVAVAVWAQRTLDGARDVVRAIRYESGSGWGNATTIGALETSATIARAAVGMDDAGVAVALWDQAAGPAGQGGRVLWSNHQTSGAVWSEAQLIKSDVTTSADGFRLDVGANGDAFAIWVQDNADEVAPRKDIWAARFSGGAWSEPARIDRHDEGDKVTPDVTVGATGTAYAVWAQQDADFANVWSAQYMPGSGWQDPVLIEPPNDDPTEDGDAANPRVDVNRAGNVFVVWRQVWDQWPSVWSNRLDPGTSWMTAGLIEEVPSPATGPIIAVDEARHAHALWVHANNSGRKIRTSRFE